MKRFVTRTTIASSIVFIATLLVPVWLHTTQNVAPSAEAPRAEPVAVSQEVSPERSQEFSAEQEPEQLIDIFSDEDISYNGYEMKSFTETIRDETKREIEVSYAALMKGDRRLLKFDGVYFVEGNSTWFGLFDLLGNGSQQFIVSQTVPRTGRHWVVSVSPKVSVLFDSFDYGVGREEFYVIDLDKDGVYEISLPVTAFYEMQDKMYIGEIPLPEIIFKFDAKAGKYLPANHLFPDYALRGIDQDIAELRSGERNYLSSRLDILLRYVYARKAKEGWAFFDRAYRHRDKQEIEARIRSVLRRSPGVPIAAASR